MIEKSNFCCSASRNLPPKEDEGNKSEGDECEKFNKSDDQQYSPAFSSSHQSIAEVKGSLNAVKAQLGKITFPLFINLLVNVKKLK